MTNVRKVFVFMCLKGEIISPNIGAARIPASVGLYSV